MTLRRYFRYADAAREERPLYLFDPKFAEKVPELDSDYQAPVYFREDLFALLGRERPDYRWVIIGPAGSGSSFHVDSNSTSAWNAVVSWSKRLVMFPPEVVPPGVHPSLDGAEVACPVSIMEWFMNFYERCKTRTKRPVECSCRAGEVVFCAQWLVPFGHQSRGLRCHHPNYEKFVECSGFSWENQCKRTCLRLSGTKDRVNLYDKFRSAIDAAFPGLINRLELEAQERTSQKKKLSFWESVTDANAGGFSFSF